MGCSKKSNLVILLEIWAAHLLLQLTLLPSVAAQEPKSVFAHFLVGNAASMTPEQWNTDIAHAKKAHIDGFALNIAYQDRTNNEVLEKAYTAAETMGSFSLFLSFDYTSAGPWPANEVITMINTYKNRPAQFHYGGKPLVSTFEGSAQAGDWADIKDATGCVFMPSWTSLGVYGLSAVLNIVDGFFSWDAWPVGAQDKTDGSDREWMRAISHKPYIMPVSPWFYTNLPQWNKNWLWRGDDLWHDRLEQAIQLQPTMLELISWNDYGEAHYIGPIHEAEIPFTAARYVSDNPHDGWRDLLPLYIDKYKSSNTTTFAAVVDQITYWYRPNPANAGSDGGTTGNNPLQGQPVLAPGLVSQDKVFLTVFVAEASDVTVQIGNSLPTTLHAATVGINHFSVPFQGQTGLVHFTIMRDGQTVVQCTGPEITSQCKDGLVNWNAVVGSSENSS